MKLDSIQGKSETLMVFGEPVVLTNDPYTHIRVLKVGKTGNVTFGISAPQHVGVHYATDELYFSERGLNTNSD